MEDILLNFGDTVKVSRRRYRQFVNNGIDQGTRPELQGGGLVRSAGGEKTGLMGQKKEERPARLACANAMAGRELSDERILGSGDFVAKALEEANELGERRAKSMISLDEIIKRVTTEIGSDYKELISFKRDKRLSNARAIISYLAAIELGYTGVKIADTLRLSGKSVSRCLPRRSGRSYWGIERGKKIVDNDRRILDYLQ